LKLPDLFAAVVGVLVAITGLIGMVLPSLLTEFGESLQTLGALYVVAVIRIVFGAALLGVAPDSRTPRTLRTLGIVSITAGLVAPILGVEGFQAIFIWVSGQGPWFVRACAGASFIFGIFIVHVVGAPRR
jgi:hypothetical protein